MLLHDTHARMLHSMVPPVLHVSLFFADFHQFGGVKSTERQKKRLKNMSICYKTADTAAGGHGTLNNCVAAECKRADKACGERKSSGQHSYLLYMMSSLAGLSS